ncbi:MAG: hypothetical protein ACFFEJ_15310 [Candidatus Thorarchaeota archaeon]
MMKPILTLYIKSMKISTSSADIESLGHQCASPMRTGAYDRMGSEAALFEPQQAMLLDAAIRACDKMDWTLKVIDVSKYGFRKRIQSKGKVPRLEGNNKTMIGTPTSVEIIEFFSEEKSHVEVSMDQKEDTRVEVY